MAAPLLFLVVILAGAIIGTLTAWRRGAPVLAACTTGLARAPALTFGLLSLSLFFGLLWFGRAPTAAALSVLAAVVATLFLVLGLLAPRVTPKDCATERPATRSLLLVALLGLVVLGISITFVIRSGNQPNGQWDGIAIWNMLARTLARADSGLDTILRTMTAGAPGYPEHLPASIASLFRLHGSEPAFFQQAVAGAWLAGLSLSLFLSLRRWGNLVAACAGTLLLLTTPGYIDVGAGQYADVPLACLYLGAVTSLASLFREEPDYHTPPLLAGLLVGLLPWTKNEGWVMATVLGLLLLLALWRRRLRWTTVLAVAAGAAPPLLAYALFKIYWAPDDFLFVLPAPSIWERFTDPVRWQNVAAAFWREWSSGGSLPWVEHVSPTNAFRARWGALWPALGGIVLLACRFRRLAWDRSLRFVAVAVLLQYAAVFMIFQMMPQRQQITMVNSLGRLLMHVTPVLILLVVSLAADSSDQREQIPGGVATGEPQRCDRRPG